MAKKPYVVWVTGLLLLTAYWWSVHPPDFSMGYSEDFCPDFLRQTMAENLALGRGPIFRSTSFMSPTGISMPYMSWSIERDWLGAYVWRWSHVIPFVWIYYGISLLVSYVGVGWILTRMKLSRPAAWGLATAAVLFHIPRHFKTWHHFEHLPQHWIYLSVFLDAWQWQKIWRENKVSLELEAWRGVLALATLLSTGYFWGALNLEWIMTHGIAGGYLLYRKIRKAPMVYEGHSPRLVLPFALGLGLAALEARWFLPLYREVSGMGSVVNNLGWFTRFYLPFRPLWLEQVLPLKYPLYSTETVVTLGWFWMVPLLVTFSLLRKKKGGPGIGAILPLLAFLTVIYLWQSEWLGLPIIRMLQKGVPFLSFFRVAVRWSLVMPAAIGAILALAWPELGSWMKNSLRKPRPKLKIGLTLFLISSLAEWSWLLFPVNALAPMPAPMRSLLEETRKRSGSTVLDLPFCTDGGNGACATLQCPNYPYSTMGQCLRLWHEKKVYGLYAARMSTEDCGLYRQAPYLNWFNAWREQRCYTDSEWDEFCVYLDRHPEISSILFYPDIWSGADTPECRAKFTQHLGPTLREASVSRHPNFGAHWEGTNRIFLYSGQCRKLPK